MKRVLLTIIAIVQMVLGARLIALLVRTGNGKRIRRGFAPFPPSVTVLVPVLNEAERLSPCLEGLLKCGPEVATILVIDGGSNDTTRSIVRAFRQRDDRITLVETRPAPGTNGKAHGLQAGLELTETEWVLTIDADVRPAPELVPALLRHAAEEQLSILSIATRQRLADRLDQVVHPAMLATLIYRFGIPGHAVSTPSEVQANGQCMLIQRELLERLGGFTSVLGAIAEDVALARAASRAGERVGFYETEDLVSVEMYTGGLETLKNWSRSLPLGEAQTPRQAFIDRASLLLLQAAPLYLLAGFGKGNRLIRAVNGALVATRLGILAGSRRAYRNPGALYWLSPLADLPVVALIAIRSKQRTLTWRGRTVKRGMQ